MSASLKAGCDDDIYASLFQRNCFLWGCGCADRDNSLEPGLVQNLLGRDAIDEGESGHLRIEQSTNLIFKTDWLVCRKDRSSTANSFHVWSERRQSTFEGFRIRREGTLFFHRHPEIHRKWLGGEGTDLRDDISNRLRLQAVSSKRTKTSEVGYCRGELLRRETSERSLNDGVFDPERTRYARAVPCRT